MAHPMFVKHQDLLGAAVHAIESRGGWSPYADDVAAFGANAAEEGRQAFFDAYADAQFYLDQPGVVGRGGGEVSPYGLSLNVSYPKCSADALIAAAKTAMPAWTKAGPDVRAGVCAEILARLNARSIDLAYATMHTAGQSFAMAFQDGGPRAQERGLEAVACAWREMKHVPYRASWHKARGQLPPLKAEKRYAVVPRGVALVLPSATAPTWSSYPGIFASLATGNAVIVKPHPAAILPLAITVALARQTLKEAGFDASLASLLVDTAAAPVAKDVAQKPEIRIIDHAGDADFGAWLEDNARQALVFAETPGVNCIVVDAAENYAGMLDNIAYTLSLDSGQAAGTPQAIFVSRQGVRTPAATVPAERFCRDLAAAVGRLLEDPHRAVDVLGAIQSPATLARLEALARGGEVVRGADAIVHPQWPAAAVRTPLLLKAAANDAGAWMADSCGAVAFIVETATTAESLAFAERAMREKGALTFSVHSDNDNIVQLAEDACLRTGVALALNLTGAVVVNRPMAFSDYRATGANPAASGTLTDSGFVAGRFFVLQSYRGA
ncbi:MAG: phenylacetic acid degradation protein PaaN [Rhodocyclaceae bacterium]|nr:phenylacetic acid degradation protein PaaN [Rhodocyclaceae bacterium]